MVAFIFSIFVTVALTLVVVPLSKRRPLGTPLTWGEAMVAAVYVFGLLFLAWGVVPHQWLTWAENELNWTASRNLHGPGGIFKPQANGGPFPFTMNYRHVSDTIAAGIYGVTLGAFGFIWTGWQRRGTKPSTAAVVSTYGRPLVKKG